MYQGKIKFYYVFKVRFNQFIRWKRNSRPYLTIDSFADFCEVNVTPTKYRDKKPSLKEISNAKSIFCRSDKLQDFLDTHQNIVSASIIVSGNTDFEFHEKLRNIPASVKRLYLQNCFICDDSLYQTIPIGIENFRLGVNGNPRYLKKKTFYGNRKNKVLLGPFSLTHIDRSIVYNSIQTSEYIDVVKKRIAPKKLSNVFQNYKFIAAVRGNGVDTHRIWEALYRGCIPIVQKSDWSSFLTELALPIEFVSNWTTIELKKCIDTSIINEFDPSNIASLWMPYWESRMNEDISS